jgi:hypothetical protein
VKDFILVSASNGATAVLVLLRRSVHIATVAARAIQ